MTNPRLQQRPFVLRAYDRLLDFLALVCRWITGVSLVVLTVLFGWLVYGRYILNATPTWVEQTALLLVMVIAFLGAATGIHENTHLSVNLLRDAVPAKVRRFLVTVSDIMLIKFGLAMCLYGYQLTVFKWGSQIPLLQLPEGLRSLPLTLCGLLVAMYSLGHILRRPYIDSESGNTQKTVTSTKGDA